MRRNAHQVALRAMLGSILTSDLTVSEIHALSQDFLHGQQLAQEFGSLLESTLSAMNEPDQVTQLKFPSNLSKTDAAIVEGMLLTIRMKRLSKREILAAVGMMSDEKDQQMDSRSRNMKEILTYILTNGSQNQQQRLKEYLNVGLKGRDQYLHGIMNRP